ncbi:AraC family transcriptional regulator [Paenibacillus sp. sptzw28]|uniref:helix-turn-helix transcriptional regulator n=1 Tax=Paenibacillus sp. sptzw28 TaxID=715179 RepID=UPI001C6ED157|nr:AraC family transcriptional regulator [Paenibacillus sp. sptzw28]QYR21396.1 AraC family transcriptional regulator [Paenibacillus sp. sptzw28]
MPTYMDYMISSLPIRTFDCMVDRSKLKIKSLTVANAGHLPGRTLQRNSAIFDRWAFVYISSGRGYYQAGIGPRQTVEAGSLFCLFPNTVFHYGPDEDGFWDEYYFSIEGDRIREWLTDWFPQPGLVKQIGVEDTFFSKMEMVFKLMEIGVPANQDRAALTLESLLYEMAVRARQPEIGSRSLFIHKLIDGLSDSIYQPLDSAAVAAQHHISIPTLRRMVHDYTGFPLGEFMHRLKMSEAKKLLLNTDKTVKEIAAMLGYADVFYFSRLFKKYVDAAPRTYRNRMG